MEVVTTCSENNFDYVKGLGAAAAFDYRGKDVEDQVVKWLDGKTVVGAYHAVGEGGAQAAARIVDRSKGKAIVVTVRGVPEKGVPSSVRMKASESYPTIHPLISVLMCCVSRCHGYLLERGRSQDLAGVPTQGVEEWHNRTQTRPQNCWRESQIGAARSRYAEERCQR